MIIPGYTGNYSGGFVRTPQGELALGGVCVVWFRPDGSRCEVVTHTIGL